MNQAWLLNDAGERVIQLCHKLRLRRVISVVRGLHSDVVPHWFDGVELGAVLRQRAEVETMAITSEPLAHLRSPMVGSIVVNQEHFLATVAFRQAIEKGCVALAFKYIPISVIEFRPIQIDCPKNLLRVPLARRRNLRLVSSTGPSLIESGILAETGFISKEESRPPFSGFFLTGDRCSAATDLARPGRPWPTSGVDVARKSPAL